MIGPGSELGPFIVLNPLGAGGMGAVFRAHDRRLGREVALKLLPPEFAADPYRLGLFRREALTLASLNHPGIATIHGFEEPEPGVTFLVLELVAGQSLAERLREGPIPVEEALRIAARIAEALEAAHERGVIHRDLKPGNVMLGPKGLVKVLDFGLARRLKQVWQEERAQAPPPPSSTPGGSGSDDATMASGPQSPPTGSPGDATVVSDPSLPPGDGETVVSHPVPPEGNAEGGEAATVASRPGGPAGEDETIASSPGSRGDATVASSPSGSFAPPEIDSLSLDEGVAGTPGYMSPEQILAGEQDARTDVFAFGCILYQMLAGRAAFTGGNLSDIFNATLHRDPDFEALPPRLQPRIRELVTRCLRRNVKDRLPNIQTARTELEEALGIRRAAAVLAGEAAAHPNNLPAAANALVGREKEIAACLEHLGRTRLLTLTGMGGTGKTRLALDLARGILEEYPDGAWFVDLSSITQPERVATTLASVMELREEPGQSTSQTLLDHLATRRVLLLLDNCEHLVEAVAVLVGQILAGSPEVRVLATSREALAIPEERTFPVPTLTVPDSAAAGERELRESPAIRLFEERARAAKPAFELTGPLLPAVADICRRLDGIPLAIELAAARVKVLDVEKIRAKLDDRFRLLTGGSRAALPRQQTLKATMAWSYDHLSEPEQHLFRGLSVFAGGWTLESATAVWQEDADEFEVLDLLTHLIDKSLVVTHAGRDGENRYRYLETVRQYGAEQRDATGEGPALGERHVGYFLALVETAESKLVGPEQKTWLDRLDDEQGNLLAALRWCGRLPEAASSGLRIAGAAARYWSTRGQYELAEQALVEALGREGAAEHSPERAKALVRLGGMALYRGDYHDARPPIEESLAVYRTLGDERGVARSLSGLATVATYQQDYEAAARFGEEVLAYYRQRGDARGLGVSLHNMGFLMVCRGDLTRAAEYFEEALPQFHKAGDNQQLALSLTGLAVARARLGSPAVAAAQLAGALEIVRDLDAQREGGYALQGAAELALHSGHFERAARWNAAAEAVLEQIGVTLAPAEQRERDEFRQILLNQLDPARFDTCSQEGIQLEFGEALGEVLGWLPSFGTDDL